MSDDASLLIELDALVAPAHTAVVVIDMQNDFCAPGGWTDRVVKRDISRFGAVAQTIGQLLDAARTASVPVVWVRADYSAHAVVEPMRARSQRLGITEDCCVPGTWGADWFGVAPQPDEPVVTKHCYSGFRDPALHEALQARGVRTIVFAGVQTHVCVESTLRDGHSHGYYCVVPADCVASPSVAAHDVMLSTVGAIFGTVTTLAEMTAEWCGEGKG